MVELSGAARLKRLLMATTVVLASGGVGYIASRVWPLPKRSAPVAHSVTAADPTPDTPAAVQPREKPSRPVPQVGGWVGVADPDSAPALPPVPGADRGPAVGPPPPEKAPAPKQAAIEPGPTPVEASANEPSAADAKPAPESEEPAATPARRQQQPRARARIIRRQPAVGGGGGGGAAPGTVEFAPNPAPNQAARDFMARPSGN